MIGWLLPYHGLYRVWDCFRGSVSVQGDFIVTVTTELYYCFGIYMHVGLFGTGVGVEHSSGRGTIFPYNCLYRSVLYLNSVTGWALDRRQLDFWA